MKLLLNTIMVAVVLTALLPAISAQANTYSSGQMETSLSENSRLPQSTVEVTGPKGIIADFQLGPDDDFDLDAAVRRGLAVNPKIMAVRYQLLGAEEAIRAARAAFGFVANTSYGYKHFDEEMKSFGVELSPQDVFSLNLNITQPIFTGFRLTSTFERSELTRDQAMTQIEATELDLILQIQTNFFALLQARDNVRSAQASVARLKAQLVTTRSFFEVGLRPRLDILQAETDLAQAEQRLIEAEDGVQIQMTRLNTLLNLPVDNPTNYVGELRYVPFTMRLSDGLAAAYRARPGLIIAKKRVEIAEQEAKIAKSGLYPHVNAAYNYNRQGDSPDVSGFDSDSNTPDNEWNVGVSMQWRVFDWGQTYHSYKSATQDVHKKQAEYQDLQLETTNDVQRDFLLIQDAAKRISVARTALVGAREAFRLAEARYQTQVGTSVDVLNAQASLTRTEYNHHQALADYLTAIAKLNNKIGSKKIDILSTDRHPSRIE